jgi:transposase
MAEISNFVGIDIAKERIDIYSLTTPSHKQIPNTAREIRKFFLRFKSSQTVVILENTGGYENVCLNTLLDLNFKIHRTNNNQVKGYIGYIGVKAKTDKIDAHILAAYGEARYNLAKSGKIVPGKKKPETFELFERTPNVQEKIRALAVYLSALKSERAKEKTRLQSPGCNIISDSIQRTISLMDENIKNIEKQIDEFMNSDKDLKKKINLLCQYKGVGKIIAIQLLTAMPELGTLDRRAAAALAGVTPYSKQSGKKKGYTSIKIGGRPFVKKTLFMASLSAIRFNKEISFFFNRIVAAKKRGGKMIALVACMRKMIIHLNAILRDGFVKKNMEQNMQPVKS